LHQFNFCLQMKIISSTHKREADKITIEREHIQSIELMERAAKAIAVWLQKNFNKYTSFIFFIGSGNNGGDGLAVARLLAEKKYKVKVFLSEVKISDDAQKNLEKLKNFDAVKITQLSENEKLPPIFKQSVVIDALFGSGLNRPIQGYLKEIVNHINKSNATVVAIDIPSGLKSDYALEDCTFLSNEVIVRANITLALETPYLSFFFPESGKYVGKWHILHIGLDTKFISQIKTPYFCNTRDFIVGKIRKREKFTHKGSYGHGLLIGGSYGKMGAAILSTRAAIKTGAGLISAHIPECGYNIMQIAIPEAMVSIDKYQKIVSEFPNLSSFNAVAIGPGLGKSNATASCLKDLFEKCKNSIPMVIDADALNILSDNPEFLNYIPKDTILTPHPKELDRIVGVASNSVERNKNLVELATKYHIFVILKGHHTAIATPDGNCFFNITGNPGMATGGSGDVLTGMILSLLAQGYSPFDASVLGVYLHGLAGDIAADLISEEALDASSIINNIGAAFKDSKI